MLHVYESSFLDFTEQVAYAKALRLALPPLPLATVRPSTAPPKWELSMVMARVKREHPELTDDELKKAEQDYRRFCAECKAKPNEKVHIYNNNMDQVWHAHILFTRRYAADCDAYFGYFMHHEPTANGEPILNGDPCSRDYASFRWC